MGTIESTSKVTPLYSMKTFKYSLDSKYSQTSKHVNSFSAQKELSYDNSKWVTHALPRPKKLKTYADPDSDEELESEKENFTNLDYEEESTSIKETDFTHTGFIQYLAIAWADEKGIMLRPDMFHHLICCEIAQDVIANPETYRSLYTKSAEKKEIQIVTMGDDNEFIKLLDLALSSEIPHKEFKKQMTDIVFVSQPENYEFVKRICFANSATPFYNYARSRCGFPSIKIPDLLDDWTKLYDFITKMADIIDAECKYLPKSKWDSPAQFPIINYLHKCANHIKEIIVNFEDQLFFKNKMQSIFYVEDEYRCGSGHDFPYYICGWIRDFYLKTHPKLKDYPAHLPYLPYKFNGVGNFSIVSGLISSKLKGDVLEPEYGKIVIKITNYKLFDAIKN